MSAPQEAARATLEPYERVTPQSVFKGDPERISHLLKSCDKLTWYLLEVESIYKKTRVWEPFWGEYWDYRQRIDSDGHDVDGRNIPSDIKSELIKRLQIFEAELKVACAFIALTEVSPGKVPRVLVKDLVNLQAMFWPPVSITTGRREKPDKVVDEDPHRVVRVDGRREQ